MIKITIWDLNKASLYATGILVCQCMFDQPKMHFSLIKKPSSTSQTENTYDEEKSERAIGNSFEGAFTHAKNRLKKTQALHHNPNNRQFPTYRGTENADLDDGSTGELEGFYGKMLVLLSRFAQLPIRGILQDICNRMDISPSIAPLAALTFPDPNMMFSDITNAVVDCVLG